LAGSIPAALAGVWLRAGEPLRTFLPYSLHFRSLRLDLAKRARHSLSIAVARSAPSDGEPCHRTAMATDELVSVSHWLHLLADRVRLIV
jgi:hypothetical protein